MRINTEKIWTPRRMVLFLWLLLCASPANSQGLSQTSLTFDERVRYQRAIEEVYWRHRIWPNENPKSKPALDQVMPLSTIRAKVEDYLRKSEALGVFWQRPITEYQLQAEMDRMARQTKQPEILRELWAALGHDPIIIAECLARPTLANRLIRNWYAHDERYHGALKQQAEGELRRQGTMSQMRKMSSEYRELEWVKAETVGARSRRDGIAAADSVTLNPEQWVAKVRELVRLFAGLQFAEAGAKETGAGTRGDPRDEMEKLDRLPLYALSQLQEKEDRFYVMAVLEKGNGKVKVASLEWKKEAFAAWWNAAREQVGREVAVPGYTYRLPEIGAGSSSCIDDTWTPTPAPPDPRAGHTTIWTGTEMIVWGGGNSNTGGRYYPATDSWTPTSTLNAPSARSGHTAVWTGSEMIVWGGNAEGGAALNTGGRYDPGSETWTPTSTLNVPSARYAHAAIWTGSEMINWGGVPFTNSGGRYDPAADRWTPISTLNAPSARLYHGAVWTGSELIIWGGSAGFPGSYLNTGGRYDPATDSWRPTSTANAPGARSGHTAVWTGSEMIVWGGSTGDPRYFDTGGRYDPATDSWTVTSTLNAPSARRFHSAVWVENEMIVWGGAGGPHFNTGGRYDPGTDRWTSTSTLNAPSARSSHTAVWTGSEMIVWGGFFPVGYFNTGGRYDPATDTWTPTATLNAPSPRTNHTAVWTGNEMIIWGGQSPCCPDTYFNTGGRYDPITDSWTPTSTLNAPSARSGHTAVWTGTEMIVWGGAYPYPYTDTGGRYDPASDSWMPTSTLNAPSPRSGHTTIWTGNEMIVWGGTFPLTNTGGRYFPATDSWVITSMLNAPSARDLHTAIWTGNEMIVWGGFDSTFANTGGRYNPGTDTWAPTSTQNAPSGRFVHTAVWTGREMIVWGGQGQPSISNTGGRYDPTTDSWTATSMLNAPTERWANTGVWTGSEMIVWGGVNPPNHLFTGGRYNPASDSWRATGTLNVPRARRGHTAVWTGSEMIVWGGGGSYAYAFFATGGRYCASAVKTVGDSAK